MLVTNMPFWPERVGAPRSLAVEFPFGHILGQAHNREMQRRVILQALDVLERSAAPGVIVHFQQPWPEPFGSGPPRLTSRDAPADRGADGPPHRQFPKGHASGCVACVEITRTAVHANVAVGNPCAWGRSSAKDMRNAGRAVKRDLRGTRRSARFRGLGGPNRYSCGEWYARC